MKKIKYLCPHCESENVIQDAIAYWDFEDQEWKMSDFYSHPLTCGDCGSEFREPDQIEIETGEPSHA